MYVTLHGALKSSMCCFLVAGQSYTLTQIKKIGPKLKIVNDTVTSIIGKQGKMRFARMNSAERNLQRKATNRG